ncbi:MAG TPA: hypothetical protein VFC19_44975 [Candidatus Limnocylindrales bacterium]|nr:hypothetical protein [Candidatus Limnocylindrales bacterium]
MTTDTAIGTIEAATQTRTLIQAEVYLKDRRYCPISVETTPIPGLGVIPALRTDPDNPALASYNGRWAVLHLNSGHTVTAAVDGLAQAREQARLLGELPIDWTATAEVIKAVDQQTREMVSETWITAAFYTDGEDDDEY